MSDEFLHRMWAAPSPEFAHLLLRRLHALEASPERPTPVWRRVPVTGTAVAVLLLTGTLAFPQVRATARAFLDLFRETSVAGVQLDPSRFEHVRESSGHRSPALLLFAAPEILQDSGAPVVYPTPEAAAAATGIAVRVLSLPAPGLALDGVEVTREGRMLVKVDREMLVDTLDRLDLQEVRVPRQLAEGSIELYQPSTVTLRYAGGERHLQYTQGEYPDAKPSEGLDLRLLGEIGLRVWGVDADEAHRLSQSIDWISTLSVPMPAGADSFDAIAVRGQAGLLVSSPAEHTLAWVERGALHVLAGNLPVEELVASAESLQ